MTPLTMDLYAGLGFEVATRTIDWRKPFPERGKRTAEDRETP